MIFFCCKKSAAALFAFCALWTSTFAEESPWRNVTVAGAIKGCNPKIADDFYAASNREFLLNAVIPEGYATINAFTEREIEVKSELLSLMTDKSLKGHDAQNVQNLYALFLDWEGRKGAVQEIKKIISRVSAIKNARELSLWLSGEYCLYNARNLCGFEVGGDITDSSKSSVTITPTTLTLGDSEEYKALSENGRNAKECADSTAIFVLQKLGFGKSQAQKILDEKYKFERSLASSMFTQEELNSPDVFQKILNKKSFNELKELSPNFPLVQIMALRGMDKAKRIYLEEPEWLKKLNELFSEQNLELIKAYIISAIAIDNAAALDKETYDFAEAAGRKRMGVKDSEGYEKNACDFVSSAIPVQLSKLYAKSCVDKKAKKRVVKIIKQTIAQYKTIIVEQDWLCETTKKKALRKLSATKIHVAYPALWDNYSSLNILSAAEGENFFSAVQKIRAFYIKQANGRVNRIFGSGMWNAKVYEVNAFNSFTSNSINIIAGILGGRFYRSGMKDEELYGTLGAVIGHEISHSFDATGSQFDKNGAMKNWWTKDDWASFKARSQKIADYFDGMNSLGDSRQSGKTVQGEAAADIGGIKAMLRLASKKQDFDYKLFFTTYAGLWAGICQREYAAMRLKFDTHPFDNLRVNVTVQQFDEFHSTFGIKPGDLMYLAPEDRIGIW